VLYLSALETLLMEALYKSTTIPLDLPLNEPVHELSMPAVLLTLSLLLLPLQKESYVFSYVCVSVCLLTGLHKNC